MKKGPLVTLFPAGGGTRLRVRAVAGAAAICLLAALARPGLAGPVTFTLISSQSTLNAAFDVSALGGALTASEQKAGSLTSRYNGSVVTNISNLGIGGTGIKFYPGIDGDATAMSGIAPAVGGGAGTAPADYGVRLIAPVEIVLPPIDLGDGIMLNLGTLQSITVNIALRDVMVDIATAGFVPMVPMPTGTFDASMVDLTFSGMADINAAMVLKAPDILAYVANLLALQALAVTLQQQGINVTVTGNLLAQTISVGVPFQTPLSGTVANQAGMGLVENLGPVYRLTLPVEFDALEAAGIDGILGINAVLSGQFVGTAPFTLVPEPATWSLVLLGGLGLVAARRRLALRLRS